MRVVIAGAGKDVVVILNDGLAQITIAAGEIHDVVVSGCGAKEAVSHDAMPACLDALGSVQQLKGGSRGWKIAIG